MSDGDASSNETAPGVVPQPEAPTIVVPLPPVDPTERKGHLMQERYEGQLVKGNGGYIVWTGDEWLPVMYGDEPWDPYGEFVHRQKAKPNG